MIHITDSDLISRLKNFEDHFVERKTSGDDKYDWVKTAVAFANSAPIDYPCVLYIGVRDNGEIEDRRIDMDGLQKKFNKEMTFVYPRIPYLPKVLNVGGRQCLAVIVPGSPERPHFAGLSYVRMGSESKEASEAQFQAMLASRNSKARKILEFKGKPATIHSRQQISGSSLLTAWQEGTLIAGCNQFWVTLRNPDGTEWSFSLDRVAITFDNAKQRLQLEIVQ